MQEVSRRVFHVHHSLICLYDYCVRLMDQQLFLNNMMTSSQGTNLNFNFFPHSINQNIVNMVNSYMSRRSSVVMSNFWHCTSYLHQVYKENMVSVQGCIRVPMLKDFKSFLIKNWLALFPFVRMGDIPHKHSLITHLSYSFFFFTLYMLIE